jgi:predicted O-linked N-acetylglucosamine transferase (SPINDLY family)
MPSLNRESHTFEDAVTLQRAGKFSEAEQIYRRVLQTEPSHVGALHLLGLALHQHGKHEEALRWIGRAIAREPRNAVFFNNYGAAQQALGKPIEALGSFAAALTIRPRYADALGNLAGAWESLGNFRDAERSFRAALEIDPAHRDALKRLAQLLTKQGRRPEAAQVLQQATEAYPDAYEFSAELGNVLLLDSQPAPAVEAYRKSLAARGEQPAIRFNLGNALAELDEIDGAREAFRAASQGVARSHVWHLREMLLCPTVFQTSEAIDAYRAELSARLDVLIADPPPAKAQDLVNVGFYPPFALSFQGREHRPLKEKFAALFRQWIKPLNVSPRPGKPRVGFVITRGHEGQFLRCMAGMIEGFKPEAFAVVICCPHSCEARLRQGIRRESLEFAVFTESVQSAVETIAQAGCGVLYYWEIGTDSLNYQLPFYRLAPVQVTAWGTQVTSGMTEVDYYLSSRLIETDDAQRHYTEKLHLLETLPTYQRRLPAPTPATRAHFGLPDDRPVYLCAQTVLKLHPEQDALFAAVLEADSKGVIAVKEGRHAKANATLKERMRRNLGRNFERVRFVPWQTKEDYWRLLHQADISLDTMYFSAGSTTYDLFSFHQPIVTLPGDWNIGRYTLACYRKMDLGGLIAATSEEYSQVATHLANDKEKQAQLRLQIEAKSHVLFEDANAIHEHEQFFSALLA